MCQRCRSREIDWFFLARLFTVFRLVHLQGPKLSRAGRARSEAKQLCLHDLRTRNKFGNTAAMRSSKSFGNTFLAQFRARAVIPVDWRYWVCPRRKMNPVLARQIHSTFLCPYIRRIGSNNIYFPGVMINEPVPQMFLVWKFWFNLLCYAAAAALNIADQITKRRNIKLNGCRPKCHRFFSFIRRSSQVLICCGTACFSVDKPDYFFPYYLKPTYTNYTCDFLWGTRG